MHTLLELLRPWTARWLLACTAALCACETEYQVLSTDHPNSLRGSESDDAGAGGADHGSGPVSRPPTSSSSAGERMSRASDFTGVPPPATSGITGLTSQAAVSPCEPGSTKILTDLDPVQVLALSSSDLYVSSPSGVVRSAHDGSDASVVIDHFVVDIWADDDFLFSLGYAPELDTQGHDGGLSVLMTWTGEIDGVSQDEDFIYAVADGNLVRVSKATKAMTRLVEGTSSNPLHWSGTAVDDSFVYFVSYGSGTPTKLERARKIDGSDREVLLTNVTDVKAAVRLMVDADYVYVSGVGTISRVALTGGAFERIARTDVGSGEVAVMAQNATCVFYAAADAVMCSSKANGTPSVAQSIAEGSITALATRGTDLYFGVSLPAPEMQKQSWVGRLGCGTPVVSD